MPDIIMTITATVFGTVVYFGCVWLAVYGIACAVIGRTNVRRLKEKKKAERRAIIARQHMEVVLHEHILRERHKRDGKWIVVDGGECRECDVTHQGEDCEDGRAARRKGQSYRQTEERADFLDGGAVDRKGQPYGLTEDRADFLDDGAVDLKDKPYRLTEMRGIAEVSGE